MQSIKPVPVDFGSKEMETMYNYVAEQVQNLKQQWQSFHMEKLPEYKRYYDGTPREETKSFPWRNASNVVIQVVGQHVDTLQARIMGSIYESSPMFPISVLGSWKPEDGVEEQRTALEDFLNYCSLSPDELDLYRVESLWCGDTMKYGIGVIKSSQDEEVEQQFVDMGAGVVEKPLIKYNGPRPEKVALEDFAATIDAPTLERARFVWYRKRLTKYELEERKYQGHYDSKAVDELLKHPDQNGPSPEKLEEYQRKGFDTTDLYNSGEWHIYECWFPYWHNGKKHRIICNFHLGTKKSLRCVFNFYPDNELAFVLSRLGYRQDGLIGKGFSELLKDYQEEITAGHNQRVDNRTIANTSILRVAKNTFFDTQFSVYPMMTIPGDAGDVERVEFGSVLPPDISSEILSLKLAEDRSGVGPSTSGMGGLGSGTVGKTTGAYSSMGTMSILQDGNRTVASNITDFKYAHMKAGLLFAKQYAFFGTGGREQFFGERSQHLQNALQALLNKRLGFNIKAATASINREVEKQNYLLLSSILQRHYTAIGQIIQAVQNPNIDQILKDYLIKAIKGSDQIMEKVLMSFGIDDKSRILPTSLIEGVDNGQGTAAQNVGGNNVREDDSSSQDENPSPDEGASMEAFAGLLGGN